MHLLILLLASLGPGRYIGTASEGRVELDLGPDERAVFGGAPYRWRIADDRLYLEAPGQKLVLRVDGTCLVGPPFGRVCFEPAPLPPMRHPPKPPRPEAWRGGWAHTASGGTLVVVLAADGVYEMRQSAQTTTGRWRGDATGFTLVPEGGMPLRYRARRDGEALVVSGGDLPSEVRFHRWDVDRYNPAPTVSGGVP